MTKPIIVINDKTRVDLSYDEGGVEIETKELSLRISNMRMLQILAERLQRYRKS